MTTAVQHRRGTTSEHSSFTGLVGEVTIDTTKDTAVIHDGSLAGGYPLAKENLANVTPTGLTAITGADTASDDKFFIFDQSASALKSITRAELNNAIEQDALANVAITGGTINGTSVGATTPSTGSFTTLAASGAVTLNGGTANGVAYLNGSKVLTTGSALTFDGSVLTLAPNQVTFGSSTILALGSGSYFKAASTNGFLVNNSADTLNFFKIDTSGNAIFYPGGSEQMRLTSTGLGIGTSNPNYKLHVASTGLSFLISGGGTGTQYQAFNTSGGNYYLGASSSTGGGLLGGASAYSLCLVTESARDIHFGTNNTLRATIDTSGNLGLGVTPSAWTLRTLQIGYGGFLGTTAATDVRANAFYDGANKYIGTGYGLMYQQNIGTGTHAWYTAPSGTAGNAISFSQVMTLDASGNLGIGTSSPGYKLDIGNATANSTQMAGTTGGVYIYGIGRNGVNGAEIDSYDAITFRTGSTSGARTGSEKMRLDQSGNLGLGVTPSAWETTVEAIQVANTGASFAAGSSSYSSSNFLWIGNNSFLNSSGQDIYVRSTAAAQYRQLNNSHAWFTAPSGTAGNAISFTQAATLTADGDYLVGQTSAGLTDAKSVTLSKQYGVVYVNHLTGQTSGDQYAIFGYAGGSIGSITQNGTTAVAYNTSSDYRLKNITGPITTSGAYIDSLNPVEGTWKADGSTFVGLIAHEVQEASRTQVATGVKDGEEMQAMDYSSAEIIANLIAEVKSLRARVAALEAA